MQPISGHVLCVSWTPALATTRTLLLKRAGFKVTSALGKQQALKKCKTKADLMVLGHSVPREEKSAIIDCFRENSSAPVLSLLRSGQNKLPEADYGVEASNPDEFLETVRKILEAKQ